MTVSSATLTESGAVAAAGQCMLSAAVTSGGTQTTYTAEITIRATNLPPQAGGITVSGGSYFPSGETSALVQANTLTIQSLTVPQTVINGGSGSIFVTPNNPSDVTRAVVTFDSIPGYFLAPVTVVGNQVRVDFQISADFINRLEAAASSALAAPVLRRMPRARRVSPPANGITFAKRGARGTRVDLAASVSTAPLGIGVQLVSATDGTASAPVTGSTTVQGVGSGPIKVSLTWSAPVDLDLHVVTPDGGEIYYGNRLDSTNGTLDLDSNAGCAIDNVDNENIAWADSATPAGGTYTVRVDYWSNCGLAQPIPFTVRVVNCGQVSDYSGTLTAAQADEGAAGAGTTITTFSYQPCSGFSAAGKVSFEDVSPTAAGIRLTPVLIPVEYATVEIRQKSDDTLLATTQTDVAGQYSVTFNMPTPGPYYAKVLSQQVDGSGNVAQSVVSSAVTDVGPAQENLYSARSAPVDASTTMSATGVDITATQSDKVAPAFNILFIGRLGYLAALGYYNIALPPMKWHWTDGVRMCASDSDFGSCYIGSDIYINGLADDRHGNDANNDSVIAHEFGHYVNANAVLRNLAPGGTHSWLERSAPGLAWSEGLATFWGQNVLGTSAYIQAKGSGVPFVVDIETPNTTSPGMYPVGTSDGTLNGNVDEVWVAAILWDLADNQRDSQSVGNTTYTDTIANPFGTFTALARLKTTTHNRGGTALTLVDFLDQWLCSGYSAWSASPPSDVYSLVTGLNQFPYTPPSSLNCN
jgi:hypothetical protein